MADYRCFESRETAGKVLADKLEKTDVQSPVLLALPRGGIQVAEALADSLRVPIDIIVAKKLPLPAAEEVAFGAMTEDEINILNNELINTYGIDKAQLESIYERVNQDIKHRISVYGRLDESKVKGATAIIVDDGIATGSSLIAAIRRVKTLDPAKIIVAVPVSSKAAFDTIAGLVDEMIVPIVDDSTFFAVSRYYMEWGDLRETEIVDILQRYRSQSD